MKSREDLHDILANVLGSDQVYFQPPESFKLKYPCIVYNLSTAEHKWSGDKLYFFENRYDVTVMTKDPDSKIKDALVFALPYCRFDRRFVNDNLYHDAFTLYW